MKKINVELTGISPLLMNNPQSMIEDMGTKVKQRTAKPDIKADAERLAYKNSKGELYVPSTAIKGTLIGAASWKKIGKYAAKPIIAGGVMIPMQEISLKTKDYEIDLRTVVIQRQRVVKARPRIDKWKLCFELVYNENLINDPEMIKSILEEAGARVGLLDFRPQKNGSFGMFEVTKWEEQ